MVNTRQKGKQLEKWVAQQIVEKGLDDRAYARGDSGSGNIEKTDVSTTMQVLGQNAGIECKFAEKAQITEWLRQTQKLEDQGYEPILVYKLNRELFASTKVVIYLETFLELVKGSQGIEVVNKVESSKTKKAIYFVDRAKTALKAADKLL